MARPSIASRSIAVRSIVLPFYKELHLPLPPFGAVHRAIESFQPDIVHIATEATLGWSVLRRALRRRLAVVSSFHTNFDQYSGHYGSVGREPRSGDTCAGFITARGKPTSLRRRRSASSSRLGFKRLVLWKRGVDSSLFRPDRPGRLDVRRAWAGSPEDVVITYVSRIAPEKERRLSG